MKRGSTHFLRFVIVVFGMMVLALSLFGLPNAYHGAAAEFPYAARDVHTIISILYATTIPFFFALWQTLKLLRYIDQNAAFSISSVRALHMINYGAVAISLLYFACLPFLFPIADGDDAPGLLIIGGMVACAPLVIAVFATVLARLLQNAIDIKSENDLTV